MDIRSFTGRHKIYFFFFVFSLLGVIFIQSFNSLTLYQFKGVSKTINVAGRQRTLSQRIAKRVAQSSPERPLGHVFYQDVKLWQSNHKALWKGSDSLGTVALEGKHIQGLFQIINPNFEAISLAVARYQQGEIPYEELRRVVDDNEKSFLSGMDAIVLAFEEEAESALNTSERIELAFSLVAVCIICVMYILFFRPAIRTMFLQFQELQRKDKELAGKNAELEKQVNSLQESKEEQAVLEEELRAALAIRTETNQKLEKNLRQIEQMKVQMQEAQAMAKIGYWSYDLNTEYLDSSPMMYHIFDVRQTDKRSLSLEGLAANVHPEDQHKIEDSIKKAIQEQEVRYQYRILDQEGRIKHLSALLRGQYDKKTGHPVAVFGVIQDVTDAVRSAQTIQRFNESLKHIVRLSTEMDKELHRSIEQALEYTTNLLGMQLGIVSHISQDRYRVELSYNASPELQVNNGDEFSFATTYCELTYRQEDLLAITDMENSAYSGHPCYQAFKLESYIGIPLFVRGIKRGTLNFSSLQKHRTTFTSSEKEYIRLLAQVIEFAMERNEIIEELRTANKDQENILHVVAHDLRSPLNKLYTLFQLVVDQRLAEDEQKRMVKAAEVEYRGGTQLMEELLMNFQDTNIQIEKEHKDISEALELQLNTHQQLFDDHEVKLQRAIATGVQGYIFTNRFRRMVDNLLSNALKFTPRQGRVGVSLYQEAQSLRLVISDTGIGMPIEVQERLFDRFNKKVRRPGLNGEKSIGLGLSIVKQIVEQHNGQIHVSSVEGEGTTFSICMPINHE